MATDAHVLPEMAQVHVTSGHAHLDGWLQCKDWPCADAGLAVCPCLLLGSPIFIDRIKYLPYSQMNRQNILETGLPYNYAILVA